MEHDKTTFLSLPVEVQMMILTRVIPSDSIFRLKSREPLTSHIKRPPHHASKAKWLYIPQTKIETPVEIESALPADILKYLLLNSNLYQTILQMIYSDNTFSFPDVYTAKWFALQISPLVLPYIRSVHIDVCGTMFQKIRSASLHMYRFDHAPDPTVLNVPKLFPGLHELRIAGIGYGVIRDDIQGENLHEQFSDRATAMEDRTLFDLDSIKLLARIIGIAKTWEDVDNQHVLKGAKVFAERVPEVHRYSKNFCEYQASGVRIVPAKGDSTVYNVDEDEEEVDVALALEQSERYFASKPIKIARDEGQFEQSEAVQRRIEEQTARSHRKSGNQNSSSWGTWLWNSIGYRGANQVSVEQQVPQRQWYGA